MTVDEVLEKLHAAARPENLAGMARYGIRTDNALGINIPILRALARKTGTDHSLALELWASGIHDARILAGMVDDPRLVDSGQMEAWVADFDSWDLCDQVCSNLFDRTAFAWDKARAWSARPEEFVKRAGFTLMACLAVHDKTAADADFLALLPLVACEAGDSRNFVKKAVNWALRGIGKRNTALHGPAVALASELCERSEPPARWIGRDAIRELTGDKVRARLGIPASSA